MTWKTVFSWRHIERNDEEHKKTVTLGKYEACECSARHVIQQLVDCVTAFDAEAPEMYEDLECRELVVQAEAWLTHYPSKIKS
tara:strand:+ start:135 stop:383 length:249 start_codon:yes stop_codon:yes gene_type:complete